MMIRRVLTLAAVVLAALLAIGCGVSNETPKATEGASITGATLNEESAGEKMPFTVEVKEAGEPIGVDLRGVVSRGTLRAQLRDAEGQVVWEGVLTGTTPVNVVVRPPRAGKYALGVVWDGAVTASYSLTWRPGTVEVPRVTAVALLGGLGMIVVAVAFVVYAAVRRLGWGYLGWGALGWVVAVALKFVWAILFNQVVYQGLYGVLPKALADPLFCIYVGSLTGIFEVCVIWLVLRYTRLGKVPWPRALAFGIGFGAVEALLLGATSLLNMLIAMIYPSMLPTEALEALAQGNNVLWSLAPIVERLAVVYVHILANVLMFYAIQKRRARWLWVSSLYMTALDSVAAFGQFWGITTLARIWTLEAAMVLFGIVGWLGMRWVARNYPSPVLAAELATEAQGTTEPEHPEQAE